MKKYTSRWFLVFTLVLSVLILGGCKKKASININDSMKKDGSPSTLQQNSGPSAGSGSNEKKDEGAMMKKELQKTDITIGNGPEAKNGNKIKVDYTGTLEDGIKFDSSYDRGQPFEFVLGTGGVIKGWDLGVLGMKAGGKRKLVIPSDLAYGDRSPSPLIPPNSTLVFEVELLEVDGKGAMMEAEKVSDIKEQGAMMKKEEDATMVYKGAVLAGKQAKVLDFNKADYDAALKSNNLVVLYFYATWCPLCKLEIPKLYESFNQLSTDKVVGFRVNYNDDDTDDAEKALAREFGVAYQHTKVFVKNGKRVLKSPESWDTQRYISEINSQLSK